MSGSNSSSRTDGDEGGKDEIADVNFKVGGVGVDVQMDGKNNSSRKEGEEGGTFAEPRREAHAVEDETANRGRNFHRTQTGHGSDFRRHGRRCRFGLTFQYSTHS